MAVVEVSEDFPTSIDGQLANEVFYGVKLTGVPRDATENDVRQFFNECTPSNVIICDGGNVFVQLSNQQDFEYACSKDGHQLRWTKVGVLAVVNRQDFDSEISGVVSSDPAVPDKGEHETVEDAADKEDESQYNVIRLRGLPYSATAADVMNFLKNVTIDKGEKGVHFSSGSYGRSTGEVFVEVCTPEDVNVAMKFDREHMGGRYIEIFRSSRAQLDWECRGAEKSGGSGGVVRLRGLPYGCSADDIRDFLKGIAIVDNGITIQADETGRETGEAFIEVETDKDVEKALDRHKKSIGHRYIEVFRTTRGDIRPVANRWASYSRPSPYPARGRGYDGPRGGRYGGRGRGRGGGDYGGSYGNSYHYNQYEDPYYRGNQDGGRSMGGGGGGASYPPMRSTQPVPQYSGSAGKHAVRMRGLPFSVTIRDIQAFFSPLIPINIVIERDEEGRLSGEGEVSFGSHNDATEAMRKDRSHIGSRYIELFLHSRNDQGGISNSTGSTQPQAYESSWTNDTPYSSTYPNAAISQDPRSQSQGHAYQQQYSQQVYQQQQPSGVYGTGTAQQYRGGEGGATQYAQQQGSNMYSQTYGLPAGSNQSTVTGGGYGYGTQQQQAPAGGGATAGAGRGSWY